MFCLEPLKISYAKIKRQVRTVELHFVLKTKLRSKYMCSGIFTWNAVLIPEQMDVPPLALVGKVCKSWFLSMSLFIWISSCTIVAWLLKCTIPTQDLFSIIWLRKYFAAWFILFRRSEDWVKNDKKKMSGFQLEDERRTGQLLICTMEESNYNLNWQINKCGYR